GESIRRDGKYQFKYMANGKPKFLYSWRLTRQTHNLQVGCRAYHCASLKKASIGIWNQGWTRCVKISRSWSWLRDILRPEPA
ncbi:MAG: integrase DNA-binding domain-containing protein, partial [Succinivibrionaceae bacterium]|nr:integrase DNA-binding domain-containing protein [Succinivibrionaceae bacterium]